MNQPAKKERRGLKKFSAMILSLLQQEKQMDYTRVAEVIIAMSGGPAEDKNIRRRIYDALNVMCAINLVRKEKKMVYLNDGTGCGCESAGAVPGLSGVAGHSYEVKKVKERIEEKEKLLQETVSRKELLLKLIERNQQQPAADEKEKLHFPFILIGTGKKSRIDCETNDRQSYFKFIFSDEYQIFEDVHVLKQIFACPANQPLVAYPRLAGTHGLSDSKLAPGSRSARGDNKENRPKYPEEWGPSLAEEYPASSLGSSYLFPEDEDWLNLYNFLN